MGGDWAGQVLRPPIASALWWRRDSDATTRWVENLLARGAFSRSENKSREVSELLAKARAGSAVAGTSGGAGRGSEPKRGPLEDAQKSLRVRGIIREFVRTERCVQVWRVAGQGSDRRVVEILEAHRKIRKAALFLLAGEKSDHVAVPRVALNLFEKPVQGLFFTFEELHELSFLEKQQARDPVSRIVPSRNRQKMDEIRLRKRISLDADVNKEARLGFFGRSGGGMDFRRLSHWPWRSAGAGSALETLA